MLHIDNEPVKIERVKREREKIASLSRLFPHSAMLRTFDAVMPF